MTDSEDKTDKDQEEEKGMLENLFTDGTPPVDPEKSTEEDPEVTHEADSEGYVPTETPTEDMSEVPEVIPAQDPLNEPSPEEAETVDESSESFLGETGYAPTEEPSPETFRHAVGDPSDPSDDYMQPRFAVEIPRSGFGKAIRHPAFMITAAAALAIVAGRAIDSLLHTAPKKTDETHEAGVTLDNEELNKISSQLESLKTDFNGYQALAAMREIKVESQIGSLEKSLNALDGSRESSAVISREEIEAIKEQIKEGKIDSTGYLEMFKMFERELKKIREAKTAMPGITPKETPKPEKPVVPNKEDPKEEDITDNITDDNLVIKHALRGRIQQYEDLMKKITNDEVITPSELAKVTNQYRAVSGLLEKNHVFYGELSRDSKTIKTLELIAGKYLTLADKIILKNEEKNMVLRINIEIDGNKSTGWISSNVLPSSLCEISKKAYDKAAANYGSAVPLIKMDEKAKAFTYELLEKAGAFRKDKRLTREVLDKVNITGIALRLTSPEGAELTAKDLKNYKNYFSAKEYARGD